MKAAIIPFDASGLISWQHLLFPPGIVMKFPFWEELIFGTGVTLGSFRRGYRDISALLT